MNINEGNQCIGMFRLGGILRIVQLTGHAELSNMLLLIIYRYTGPIFVTTANQTILDISPDSLII